MGVLVSCCPKSWLLLNVIVSSAVSLVWLTSPVQNKLVRAYVLPHGSLALDPSHANFTNSSARNLARTIHRSLLVASRDVADQNPDVIFLSTPHGLADLDKFLLYLNTEASGVAFADSCTDLPECAYKLQVSVATNESLVLTQRLRKSHQVSGISGFGGGAYPLPLAWAEITPLFFIPRLNTKKVIVLSHPSRRYNQSEKMIPELLHLGRSLFLLLDQMAERVAVVVSADLAHTHSKDGPYGFSPAAQPFDDAIGTYLRTLEASALLETAGELVDEALSCGYTGLVMLHGVLSEAGLKTWKTDLLVNGHPTYYGMAVAIFKR